MWPINVVPSCDDAGKAIRGNIRLYHHFSTRLSSAVWVSGLKSAQLIETDSSIDTGLAIYLDFATGDVGTTKLQASSQKHKWENDRGRQKWMKKQHVKHV